MAFMLSLFYMQRSVIIRFFSVFWGWGDVINLVYGSSSSSYMDCEVHCVSVTIRLIGIRFTQCSYVVAFVDDLFIHGCSFYGSTTLIQ